MAYSGRNLYSGAAKGRGELSADDFNYFLTQRRQIGQQYSLGKAQNAYERNSARTNYYRMRANLQRQYKDQVPQLMQSFADRNLLRSGLYSLGYDRFNAQRNADLGELLAQHNERVGALNLADQQLYSIYKSGLDDLASAGAARRATVAEELRRARTGL